MKKLLGLAVIAGFLFAGLTVNLSADGCYTCASGGPCQQCRYGGSDTFDQRKRCEKIGCKVTGTSSCSSASNVKVCAFDAKSDKNNKFDLVLNGKK